MLLNRFNSTNYWEGITSTGYTNNTLPTANTHVLVESYFDTYHFPNAGFTYQAFTGNAQASNMTRDLATGSQVRVFDGSGNGSLLTTVSYYDNYGRAIQAYTQNHLGGNDRVDTYYDCKDQVSKTIQYHKLQASSNALQVQDRYAYDHSGRMTFHYSKVGNDPEVLMTEKVYNSLGQLIVKDLHQKQDFNFMQQIKYTYNVRGWLKSINNTALNPTPTDPWNNQVFGQELYYNTSILSSSTSPHLVTVPRYNGDVAAMTWKTKSPGTNGTDVQANAYVYRYDSFGQLLAGYYGADRLSDPGNYIYDLNDYSESEHYDLGGNIIHLKRYKGGKTGPSLMDNLTYQYNNNGNQLRTVNEAAETQVTPYKQFVDPNSNTSGYTYNADGQMTDDGYKDISESYYPNGEPATITKNNSYTKVSYLYDAVGNKLRKTIHYDPPANVPSFTERMIQKDYIGRFVYEKETTQGTPSAGEQLQYILTDEGMIRPTPSTASNSTDYVYDYFIKDYLGNVRAIVTEENATEQTYTATMETQNAPTEEAYFDNINSTRTPVPLDYPYDPSYPNNTDVSQLGVSQGKIIGPSKLLKVKQGDTLNFSAKYFYTDSEITNTSSLEALAHQLLLSLANAGAGTLPLTSDQLATIADPGSPELTDMLRFLNNSMDTAELSKPQGYLIYTLYDAKMNIVPSASGVIRVEGADQLATLAKIDLKVPASGYMQLYVANASTDPVSFDNHTIERLQGNLQLTKGFNYMQRINGKYQNDHTNNWYKISIVLNDRLEKFNYIQTQKTELTNLKI